MIEVENQAPANQQTLTVEVVDYGKQEVVRWFVPVDQKWRYQIDLEGKIYDLKENEDGTYSVL